MIQLAGKKDGPRPKLKEKMRAAFQQLEAEDRKAIDREPVKKSGCDCGCKKA